MNSPMTTIFEHRNDHETLKIHDPLTAFGRFFFA